MNPSTSKLTTSFRRFPRSPLFAFVLCVLLSFLVYFATLAPTVYTFDSGEFAAGAYTLGIVHPTGYPLYLVLAKVFTFLPIGDVAYRVNLMSALFGAVTIGLLYSICFRLTANVLVSAAASLMYAFSYFFWREAVIAEIYTLNTALLLALLLLILRDDGHSSATNMGIAGLVFGLALANHMSTILVVPALAYWVLANRVSKKGMFSFAVGALVGLLFYLYLPIRYLANPPLNYARMYLGTDLSTVQGIWSWITGETFRQFMVGYNALEFLGEVAAYLTWLWTNFLGAGFLIGLVGIVAMALQNRKVFVLLAIVYSAYTLFFINYRVVDKDTMFSVSYLVWTIWIAFGAKAIVDYLGGRAYTAVAVPAVVMLMALVALTVNYASVDQSRNTMARDFAGQLLDSVAPSALIVTEWTWATPLEYLQIVEQRRPDVTIYDRGLAGLGVWSRLRHQGIPDEQATPIIEDSLVRIVAQQIATRPVYATEYDETLARMFDFVPIGRYYRLVARPLIGMLP